MHIYWEPMTFENPVPDYSKVLFHAEPRISMRVRLAEPVDGLPMVSWAGTIFNPQRKGKAPYHGCPKPIMLTGLKFISLIEDLSDVAFHGWQRWARSSGFDLVDDDRFQLRKCMAVEAMGCTSVFQVVEAKEGGKRGKQRGSVRV